MTNSSTTTSAQTHPAPFHLAWLGELELSLRASQKSLLARDLAGIDARTREQELFLSGCATACSTSCLEPLSPAEREAVARILHLCRVQAALLRRAQRWNTVLRNLIAGTAASYDPAGHAWAAPAPEPIAKSNPEPSPCRA